MSSSYCVRMLGRILTRACDGCRLLGCQICCLITKDTHVARGGIQRIITTFVNVLLMLSVPSDALARSVSSPDGVRGA